MVLFIKNLYNRYFFNFYWFLKTKNPLFFLILSLIAIIFVVLTYIFSGFIITDMLYNFVILLILFILCIHVGMATLSLLSDYIYNSEVLLLSKTLTNLISLKFFLFLIYFFLI